MTSAPTTTPKKKRLFPKYVLIWFRSYILLCAILWLIQDYLIYPGAGYISTAEATQLAAGQDLAFFKGQDGHFIGYVASVPNPTLPTRGTIIVFHGNGEKAVERRCFIDALEPVGFHVILYEYPGYGGREGHPSEDKIVAEGRSLVRWLSSTGHGPIYLWGESLGSGVVGSIAADPTLPVKGVVLLTPFHSLAGLAWYRIPFVPIPLLIRDHYYTFSNLAHYGHPIVVVQAENDEVVPKWSTDRLLAALPPETKHLVLAHCGHNDWPQDSEAPWWNQAVADLTPLGAVQNKSQRVAQFFGYWQA